MNTQETTQRRDDSDVEEAALDEESTATRGSLRDSESLEDSETEDFSQTVGFFEEALEQADRAEPRQVTRARNVPQYFGEVRTHHAVTEGDYVEPKTVYKVKLGPSGQVNKYKARYVAKGFKLMEGLDYSETFYRLPVSQAYLRHSGFYFNYQRSKAM